MQNVFAFSGTPSGIQPLDTANFEIIGICEVPQLEKIQGDEVGRDVLRRAGDGHQDDARAQAWGDILYLYIFSL